MSAPTHSRDLTLVGSESEFGTIYRSNVAAVTSYFARRCGEPQIVADLTSETFVEAIGSFPRFDPRRGSARGWLFGIARIIFARHCAEVANGQRITDRLMGQRVISCEEIDELVDRIDAQRVGRELLARWQRLPEPQREAIELVDLAGLTAKEAGVALKISPGAVRVRLVRARARLRKESES